MKQNYFIFIKKVNEEKTNLIFVGLLEECESVDEALKTYLTSLTEEDREFLETNLNENVSENNLIVVPEDSDVVKAVIGSLIETIEETQEEPQLLEILQETKNKFN